MTGDEQPPAVCGTCGRDLVPVPRPAGEGQHGAIGARVEEGAQLACPEGHDRDLAAHRFVDTLILAAPDELPVARRGRWRGPDGCGACGAALTMPARRTTRTVSPTLEGVAGVGVVTVTFDLPMVRCPECATEQVPHAAAGDARSAVEAALLGGAD